MEQQQSRFTVNLLAQFVLSLVLAGIAAELQNPVGQLCATGAWILFCLFGFGLLYGFFRLLGVRLGILEAIYEHFPVGFMLRDEMQLKAKEGHAPAGSSKDEMASFGWEQLCSFKTLRYAGILLIVSAIFSLLFNIEWDLGKKIIAAVLVAVLAMGAAEWCKRNNRGFAASLSSLISFALAQFALTLFYQYAFQNDFAPALQNAHMVLSLKFLLTCAYLFILWRYPSDVQSLLTFAIAYAGPLTLLYAGAAVSFPVGLVYLTLMTAIVMTYSCMYVQPAVWIFNAGAVFGYTYIFWQSEMMAGRDVGAVSVVALFSYVAFYLVHLICSTSNLMRRGKPEGWIEFGHLIAVHIFVALGFWSLQDTLWIASEYLGAGIFLLGMGAFAASIASRKKVNSPLWHQLTVNLAIIFSAAGLFIQVKGPWSAVGFLFYACAVLWFSLYQQSIRTRIYGFLILLVSMVKLYLQFGEIFNSIPGSVAILVVGGLLVALSYKFEDLSRLVKQGLSH